MKKISLNCIHCNAVLDVDDGLDTFYCQYCGGRIMLDGMSKAAYRAKVQVKEMEHQERLRDKEIEQERYKLSYESNEKSKDWKRSNLILVVTLMISVSLLILPQIHIRSERIEHNDKIAYLKSLEVEIEENFAKGNYDSALFKANQLYCDDGWSSEESAAWDAKREAYIEMIEAKIREEEIGNPNNIFMPSSSKDFQGQNATNVQEQLSSLGFTNIKLQPASEKAGFFNKEDTIEHILVGGKTEFSVEDYFDKDSPIIIYYYAKQP